MDEEALIKALQEGWIAHAALDVLEKEPPSHNNPMLRMENVTLTAHVASASARFDEARKRRVGYELSLVLSGHVAGKLRQSVGAAKHRAPPLAARQHGPRPEQLGRDARLRTSGDSPRRKTHERQDPRFGRRTDNMFTGDQRREGKTGRNQ